MTEGRPIDLSPAGGTMLPAEPPERTAAMQAVDKSDYESVAELVARWPDLLEGWTLLGDMALAADRVVEAYAYYRVAYHRSLDRLRQNGWRGAGRVPFSHEPNQPFLRATAGLVRCSEIMGDSEEADRCRRLLLDSDPSDPLGVA